MDESMKQEAPSVRYGRIVTKENLDRLLHGWFPRPDANWTWWIIADIVVFVSMLKLIVQNKLRRVQ